MKTPTANYLRASLFSLFIITIATVSHGQQHYDNGEWVNSHYYDLDGKRFDGQIKYGVEKNYLWFRPSKKDEKKKIVAADIKSYVMGFDSVIVMKLKSGESNFITLMIDEPLKVYKSRYDVTSNFGPTAIMGYASGIHAMAGVGLTVEKETIYYGPNTEDLTELNRKNFVAIMETVLANYPELYARIKSKEFKFDNLETIRACLERIKDKEIKNNSK